MPSDETGGSYTRVRFNAQLGDGPDQRGDVTVEVQGERAEATPDQVRMQAEEELEEATDALEDALGL